jgi:hypothetical protein
VPITRATSRVARDLEDHFSVPAEAPLTKGALAVEAKLARLVTYDAGALALRFTPRVWPDALVTRFGPLTSFVVRLECCNRPFTPSESPLSRELDAVARLEALVHSHPGAKSLGELRRRAAGYLREALRAYAALDAPTKTARPSNAPARRAPPALRTDSRRDSVRDLTLEEEVLWFFGSEGVPWGFGSSFDAMVTAMLFPDQATSPGDDGLVERLEGEDLRRTVRRCLERMPDRDAGILKAAYTPRPWPARLYRELGALTGVVVRMAAGIGGWPDRREDREARERQTAISLDAALAANGREAYRRFWTQSRLALQKALQRYEEVRLARVLPIRTSETVRTEGVCR